MKCSAYWIYYDSPHIYLFSELHIILIVKNVEKIKQINLIEKIQFNRTKSNLFEKNLDFKKLKEEFFIQPSNWRGFFC